MVYFFFEVKDWSMELVERQNIYLEILRLAQELKVEFAFPTQTLHIDTFPGKDPSSASDSTENIDLSNWIFANNELMRPRTCDFTKGPDVFRIDTATGKVSNYSLENDNIAAGLPTLESSVCRSRKSFDELVLARLYSIA